jgi:hypothetical protein
MDMFCRLEDADNDDERMNVRVLGHHIGTSFGWLHLGGHTVLCPEFRRAPGLLKFMPDRDIPEEAVVIIDYYAGLIAIVEKPTRQLSEMNDFKVVWAGRLKGASK